MQANIEVSREELGVAMDKLIIAARRNDTIKTIYEILIKHYHADSFSLNVWNRDIKRIKTILKREEAYLSGCVDIFKIICDDEGNSRDCTEVLIPRNLYDQINRDNIRLEKKFKELLFDFLETNIPKSINVMDTMDINFDTLSDIALAEFISLDRDDFCNRLFDAVGRDEDYAADLIVDMFSKKRKYQGSHGACSQSERLLDFGIYRHVLADKTNDATLTQEKIFHLEESYT